MSTTLSMAFAHTIEYFSKGIDEQNGAYYRVQYRINDWADTDQCCRELMGIGTLTGTPGSGTIVRTTPHQHPLATSLYCVSAHVVEGLGRPTLNADGYPDYDGGALIQAEYRPQKVDYQSSQNAIDNQIDQSAGAAQLWCTQRISFGTETWTVDRGTYAYVGGPENGQSTSVPAKIQIPITELVLTFHKVPYLPMGLVRTHRGRVNSLAFLGSAAGLVLFKGGDTIREWNTDGSICQQVTLLFTERDALYPWNSLPSRTSLVWYPVADSLGTKMYPTSNLNLLLT